VVRSWGLRFFSNVISQSRSALFLPDWLSFPGALFDVLLEGYAKKGERGRGCNLWCEDRVLEE
jgi:hypothetical protein